MTRAQDLVGHIDAILVRCEGRILRPKCDGISFCLFGSNSTWITEDQPCLTYGLRGVVHCAVEVRPPVERS